MSGDFMPILVVPAVPHNSGIRFLHKKEQIDISQEMADVVWRILGLCNGYNDVEYIANKTKIAVGRSIGDSFRARRYGDCRRLQKSVHSFP